MIAYYKENKINSRPECYGYGRVTTITDCVIKKAKRMSMYYEERNTMNAEKGFQKSNLVQNGSYW